MKKTIFNYKRMHKNEYNFNVLTITQGHLSDFALRSKSSSANCFIVNSSGICATDQPNSNFCFLLPYCKAAAAKVDIGSGCVLVEYTADQVATGH